MRTPFLEANDGPAPAPFPEGWYFVTSRDELRRRQLVHRTWLGEEIVVWCDGQGRICMAEAYCPHMGSSLAPAVGARVREGRLVCPFHGFEYDTTGQCVATPYAPPPRAARLKRHTTRELAGMIFAWKGIDDAAPRWQLPEQPQAGSEWSGVRLQTLRFPGHPQETTENAVDLAHLRYVHGYGNVHRTEKLSTDGAYLRSCFDFKGRFGIGGAIKVAFDIGSITHVYGLGYSQVDFEERTIGYQARLWVLSTPVDGTSIDLTLATQVGHLHRPKRAVFGLRFLPHRARRRLMNRFVLWKAVSYVEEDVLIWRRKRYVSRPLLSGADGEILAYRGYCAQFYPDRGRTARRRAAGQT